MSDEEVPTLKFRRSEYNDYNARVEAERDVHFTNGKFMYTATDSVTFRISKNDIARGWRLIVFANGTAIYDDDDVDTLKFGKLYAARLAAVPRLQEIAIATMIDSQQGMRYNTPRSVARSVRHDLWVEEIRKHTTEI